MSALKCYASWMDSDSGNKGIELIECPIYGETNESPTACGKMTEKTEDANLYCAYGSLMKQHGVSKKAGCAKDLTEQDGTPLNMEICYCTTEGCNKNCTCSSDQTGFKTLRPDLAKTSSVDLTILSKLISATTIKSNFNQRGKPIPDKTTKQDLKKKSEPDSATFIKPTVLPYTIIVMSLIVKLPNA